MNDLQKLIKLRGMTVNDVAKAISFGYHSVQKVIRGATYLRKSGTIAIRRNPEIEKAVATHLGASHAELWGSASKKHIERMIRG